MGTAKTAFFWIKIDKGAENVDWTDKDVISPEWEVHHHCE